MERPVAVVLGATGAIGQELLGQLLQDGAWRTVVTVGRREPSVLPAYPPDSFKAKLVAKTINMDKMREEAADVFKGADTVFCALGTTRRDAGSAEAFKKVDYGYVAASAELAKAGGVKHYSLVTAVGSNPNVWACDWGLFHGLLYMKTKGMAEEAVKAQGFTYTSIFRPGLLDRESKARTVEKVLAPFSNGIKVSDCGKVLVADAKRILAQAAQPSAPSVAVYEMKSMQTAAKEGKAPTVA